MDSNQIAKYIKVFVVCIFVIAIVFFVTTPPSGFPVGSTFSIERGSSLKNISQNLFNEKLIRSKAIFEFLVILRGGEKNILSGDYLFAGKTDVFGVVNRLTRGIFESVAVKIVIPEGYSNKDIAETVSSLLKNFDKEKFLAIIKDKEGFIFPDTYLFFPTTTEEEVARVMIDNFNKKIAPLKNQIDHSPHTINEIVTMASLVENEANKDADRKMVSGILWNRIAKNMPLQVDAVFGYLLNKGSSELTLNDLQYDSPYNTYKHKGLPPGPIGNPGISSIDAALNPTKSNYLYYLHDKNGIIHYATNYDQHLENKRKYLR